MVHLLPLESWTWFPPLRQLVGCPPGDLTWSRPPASSTFFLRMGRLLHWNVLEERDTTCSLPLVPFPLLLKRAQRRSGLCVGGPCGHPRGSRSIPSSHTSSWIGVSVSLQRVFSVLHSGLHFLTFQAQESFVKMNFLRVPIPGIRSSIQCLKSWGQLMNTQQPDS